MVDELEHGVHSTDSRIGFAHLFSEKGQTNNGSQVLSEVFEVSVTISFAPLPPSSQLTCVLSRLAWLASQLQ